MSDLSSKQSPSPYTHIFKTLELKNGVTLPNRIIMGSMHTGLEEKWGGFDKLAEFYKQRALGGVGLIITGGIAPNRQGWVAPFAAKLTNCWEVWQHKKITKAVHSVNGKIALQILHSGRYGYHPLIVSASKVKSPITPFKPRALSEKGVESTINDYIKCAQRAEEAGYDGVEVMGSEGYLINQFLVTRTNKRQDKWGGNYEQRIQFPIKIVEGIRKKVSPKFIIVYRLSMLDLVENGSTFEEVCLLAKKIEEAGATIINTGIGWHEARIPTIAAHVPRGAFSWVTRKLRDQNIISIPLVATNRINTPEMAESILSGGDADLISMARPFLADAEFVNKAKNNQSHLINTCIACNQACLDHTFKGKRATCLVNPVACYETELKLTKVPQDKRKKLAVVGAGPGGLSFALAAAERGHQVFLYDDHEEIGGQFLLAKKVPGKEEFNETLRYFRNQLPLFNVTLKLGKRVSSAELLKENFDEVILSTGVVPRKPQIPGIDHPKVLSYFELLNAKNPQDILKGNRFAIIGAGGIGVDVAQYLLGSGGEFFQEWGVTDHQKFLKSEVSVSHKEKTNEPQITLLQRKSGKMGNGPGKTTGWIHRLVLKRHNVQMLSGVSYEKIDDQGLHLKLENGENKILSVDHIIVCAGQTSLRGPLYEELKNSSLTENKVHLIGGAFLAQELDAKGAIRQGVELASKI
jgi:2,4-dienoyl-CoA reductase (NADPH2)